MKQFLCIIISIAFLMLNGCAALIPKPGPAPYAGPFLVAAEDSIPGVPRNILNAEYWISASADPDSEILTHSEIEDFNRNNPMSGDYFIDVLSLPAVIDGVKIRRHIAHNARYLHSAELYVTGDIPFEKRERNRIAALMDTASVKDEIPLLFGVVLRREMGKLWPTAIPLMSEPGDNEFDAGVISSIDMMEPVALLHTSKDGLWSYVQTYGFACWIHSDAAAFGDIETVRELTGSSTPLVALGHRVSVYGAPGDGTAVGAVQMGSCLPIRTAGKEYLEVLIPGRGEFNELVTKRGYVRRNSDISMGYLPYTLRNIYRQCFRLQGRRYGWGGMFEGRDCSSYVMDVFRCFGFRLPRNSAKLLQSSQCVISVDEYSRETRLEIMRSLPGGITLLGWPGHVMIYLGDINGKPYAIHAFWAWRTPSGNGPDIAHRAARVAVTDLLLGDESVRGNFIDRLTHAAVLGNYIVKYK